MKTKNLGFTLVELIVVITILAILGTILFISLNGYSASARDTKRISDISSLASKINIEQIRGTNLRDLIKETREETGQILGIENQTINSFGTINFENLRETANNFKDPSDKTKDYPIAYAVGMGSGGLRYNFFEIGTISEKEGKNKIVGNYYRLEEEDIPSLFLSGSIEYINNGEELIYEINNKQSNETEEEEIPEEPEIITRNVYGDEDLESITACNKWVEDNVGTLGGGANNWLWVPARYFITDGTGLGMNDEYYKREIIHNNIKYICNGFAVAKYEMTYEEAIEPNSTGGTWNTYKYNNLLSPISKSDRYAIAEITQLQAIASCKNIGTNINGKSFHLITNNEWMTIARNIELQANNWSNNEVGSGYIYNGISNDSTLGCSGLILGNYATKTGIGYCDEKRQLNLSNGNKIWDLAGNVWEHVNKANTIDGDGYNNGLTKIGSEDSNSWNSIYQWHKTGWISSEFDSSRLKYGPSNDNYSHTSHGVGNVHGWYTNNNNSNIFLRGGLAYHTSRVGIYAIYLARDNSNQDIGVGFRCTL